MQGYSFAKKWIYRYNLFFQRYNSDQGSVITNMVTFAPMIDWNYLFSANGQSIVYSWAIPVHAAIILSEMIYSRINHLKLYKTKDTIANVYLALSQFGIDLLMKAFAMGVMFFFYQHRIINWHEGVVYWVLIFLGQDFAYYVLHYVDHKSRLFWAVHVTHHNSSEFNITTGFRASVFEPLYRYLFFSPLALFGFNPWAIMVMYAIVQVYGTWVHTQTVKNMGILEYVLVTPSHHRVHHACNIRYLDKNFGMMLIIWDRIFGTFAKEVPEVPVKFGIYPPPKSDNPKDIIFEEFIKLGHDLKQPRITWLDRFKMLFYAPGWRPNGKGKTVRQYQKEYWKKHQTKPHQ